MQHEPPQELVALLERLELATASRVWRMRRRVRRLAGGLPRFESLWVDALAQSRVLTPLQAAEINAGRGPTLQVGPFVLWSRLPSPAYGECYAARELDSLEVARLAVFRPPADRAPAILNRLEALAAQSKSLDSPVLSPITRAGIDADRVWAASGHVTGQTAAEWMVHHGRFPAQIVLEIARQMLAGLAVLEQVGLVHGDISASGLILTDRGDVMLTEPGLRGAIRPVEGVAHADLVPEAYDYLAPERITHGAAPSTITDVYACACLWWHLLTGRPPVPGGTTPAKLRAAHTARIRDVRDLAPDTPASLADAVSAGIQRDPALRPESMARLAAMLGPPTRSGKAALGHCASRGARPAAVRAELVRVTRRSKSTRWRLAAAAAWLVAAVAIASAIAHSESNGRLEDGLATGPEVREGQTLDGQAKPLFSVSEPASPDEPDTPQRRIDDFVLPAQGPVTIRSAELRPGQCIRGESGRRPLVVVPRTGLVVRPEGLRFEHIDFVWDDSAEGTGLEQDQASILQVLAARVEFRGCSFRAVDGAPRPPVAVRWIHPADKTRAELELPSGQMQLSDCIFRHVRVGVACETLGATSIEMANVLHLGTGSLVRMDHAPRVDEPVRIGLSNVTMRNTGPVLECVYPRGADPPGSLSIQANGCVLAPGPESALLSFAGPTPPERMLSNLRWSGQGSLVLPDAVIAAWQRPDGHVQALNDAWISIAGLVRSGVEFAGPALAGPQASRIVRWQAPLRSPNPPGIDPQTLTWPGGQSPNPTASIPPSRSAARVSRFDKSLR